MFHLSNQKNHFSSTTSYLFYCSAQNGYYSSEITGLAFDPCHELLWTAHASGKVKSYQCGSMIQEVHSFNNIGSKINIFEIYEDLILCGTSNSLFGFQRNSKQLFCISSPQFHEIQAVYRLAYNNNILYVAGASSKCFTVDLETQTVSNVIPVGDSTPVVAMKANHSCVLSAHESGYVSVMPFDGNSGYNFQAHGGPLTGMDVFGELLITAGNTTVFDWYDHRITSAKPDDYLKLFDLRYPTELSKPMDAIPIPCPKHLFFADAYNGNKAVVASHNSHIHSVDLKTHHINTIVPNPSQFATINHSAISSSYQVFANVDGNQTIRLYALHSEFQGTHGVVNFNSHPFSFSSSNGLPEEYRSRDYSDYYKTNYCNQNQMQKEVQINGTFGLNNLSLNESMENIGLCRKPSSSSTNSYDYSFLMDARYLLKFACKTPISIYPPDFFLEFSEYDLRCQMTLISPWDCGKLETNIPKLYSQPNTKCVINRAVYERFNTSSQVALLDCAEAPFVSSVIRALSGVPILKKLVLSHLCRSPSCILCELHFIVRNIHVQENDGSRIPVTCNGAVREMSIYKDFETIRKFRPLSFSGICISMFCNFLFTHIFSSSKKFYNMEAPEDIHFDFYTKIFQASKESCGSCGSLEVTKVLRYIIHLNYEFYDWNQNTPFVQLLEQSFAAGVKNSEQMAQCKKCHRRANRRDVGHDVILPSVLVIDTNMTKDGFTFWNHNADIFCRRPPNSMQEFDERFARDVVPNEKPHSSYFEKHLRNFSQAVRSNASGWSVYLPSMISAYQDSDYGYVSFSSSIAKEPNRKIYALCAAVMCIGDNVKGGRFVAICKNQKPNNPLLNWTVFNDYIVTAIKEQEALYTHSSWKLPHLLFYCEIDLLNAVSEPVPIPKNIFTDCQNAAQNSNLTASRIPPPESGEIVALDSEFIKSDSQQKEHVLGRVSCINKEAEVIIDDYSLLSYSEKISDYLTQYSGISAEDLNPGSSKKFLLARKFTFFKVLFLIDNKNIFVGHALQNDFKIMNIYLPKSQCIDTSELYRLEGRQFLGLRDLVKIVFGDEIQSSSHDSIEDAMYSLRLYNHYKKCVESKHDMASWLQTIYDENQKQTVSRQRNSPTRFLSRSNLNLLANFPSYLYST